MMPDLVKKLAELGKLRADGIISDDEFASLKALQGMHMDDPAAVEAFKAEYRLRAYQVPIKERTARGTAIVNLLPLEADERITTIMALPEDEESWEALDVMFATTRGTVRRNKLSDFAQCISISHCIIINAMSI